jgi:transposase InsO family protein
MALSEREAQPGLVHHSDPGVQYACGSYTQLLRDHGVTISMSRKGNPWDKAYASHCTSTVRAATTCVGGNRLEYRTP